MTKRGFANVIVYLNDFLVLEVSHEQCQLAYDTLLQLLLDLTFTISEYNLVPPTQCLTFLGVQYTVFINSGRAERPGFECMNVRLGRPENTDLYFI